tara:strand:+ start:1341 stop:1703 length:363 start_codon:yes stop_codon:yes gene_type:complete
LLLVLQLIHHTSRDFQRVRNDIRRCKCQPLRERDIRHTIRLVDLNPNQRLILGGVLNVVAAVVWKYGCVTRAEIEGAGIGTTNEDGRASGTSVEVEPFFGIGVPMKLAYILSVASFEEPT